MTSPDDRWDLLGPYTPSRLESASPPFIGRRFGTNVNPRLCEGQSFCDFGDHSAPLLLDAYVGDMDGSGSSSGPSARAFALIGRTRGRSSSSRSSSTPRS